MKWLLKNLFGSSWEYNRHMDLEGMEMRLNGYLLVRYKPLFGGRQYRAMEI